MNVDAFGIIIMLFFEPLVLVVVPGKIECACHKKRDKNHDKEHS